MPPKPCKTTANDLKAFFSDDTALCLSTWTSPEDPHFGRDGLGFLGFLGLLGFRVWGLGLARFMVSGFRVGIGFQLLRCRGCGLGMQAVVYIGVFLGF